MIELLSLIGVIALVPTTRGIWLGLNGSDPRFADASADLTYRVENAARPAGTPVLPVPVRPGFVAIPAMTAVGCFLVVGAWLGPTPIVERIGASLLMLVPMEIGALLAVRQLRTAFRARWEQRRSDPEDLLTREINSEQHA